MALFITKEVRAKLKAIKTKQYYQKWYEKNAARLAAKRAKRYQEDPMYRAACLAASARQRKNWV